MPQRFLRPGITTSKAFNSLPFFEQSLFVRLISLVDDFGRYDAEPALIKSHAFPFGMPDGSEMQLTTIVSGLQTLDSKCLLELYEVRDKKFLQLNKWQERARAASRYPDPRANNCQQLTTIASKCVLTKPLAISHEPSPSPERQQLPAPAANGLAKELEKGMTDELRERVNTSTELENRLAALFKRSAKAPWSYSEQSGIVELSRRPEVLQELVELEWFAKRKDSYFPKSLFSLVNKWAETLDRARLYAGEVKQSAGPRKSEVMNYAREKWGDDPKCENWAISFHRHWSDAKREWKRDGRLIDWQIEFSKEISRIRTAEAAEARQ